MSEIILEIIEDETEFDIPIWHFKPNDAWTIRK
jgi:hypothetical protein